MSFCITSEMGESGRETAVGSRKGGVMALGFPRCGDGLVKPAKLNKCIPHPNKHEM
jgi:hypothetical protein